MLGQLAHLFELWMLGLKWTSRTDKSVLAYKGKRVGYINSRPVLGDTGWKTQYFYQVLDGDKVIDSGEKVFDDDEQYFDDGPVERIQQLVEESVRRHFHIPDITRDFGGVSR